MQRTIGKFAMSPKVDTLTLPAHLLRFWMLGKPERQTSYSLAQDSILRRLRARQAASLVVANKQQSSN